VLVSGRFSTPVLPDVWALLDYVWTTRRIALQRADRARIGCSIATLLTMGSRQLAVVMAPHLERADALAHSLHGEALFISVDQDGLYGGLQIFLTNDDWILRNLMFNVGCFVAQPRLLVWVGVR